MLRINMKDADLSYLKLGYLLQFTQKFQNQWGLGGNLY